MKLELNHFCGSETTLMGTGHLKLRVVSFLRCTLDFPASHHASAATSRVYDLVRLLARKKWLIAHKNPGCRVDSENFSQAGGDRVGIRMGARV